MTVDQLDIYGGHTPIADVNATDARSAYSSAQMEILRMVRLLGNLTSTQAGKIIHAHREGGCNKCRATDRGHCKWAASDGGDGMKRLAARGLVRRVREGTWVAVHR